MEMSVICPNCGRKLKAPVGMASRKARCVGCGTVVDIPEPSSAETLVEMEAIDPSPRGKPPVREAPSPLKKPSDNALNLDLQIPDQSALSRDEILAPEGLALSGQLPDNMDLSLGQLDLHLSDSELAKHEGSTKPAASLAQEDGSTSPDAILESATQGTAANVPSDVKFDRGRRYYKRKREPGVWLSVMGVDLTTRRVIVLLILLALVGAAGYGWVIGPGNQARIVSVEPVNMLVAMSTLTREPVKAMAGVRIPVAGMQGSASQPAFNILGKDFPDEYFTLGGSDQLIFTRPDKGGNYLLVHVKIGQRTFEEQKMTNRYDLSFLAGQFQLQAGQETLTPILLMGQVNHRSLVFSQGSAKIDDVQSILPADIKPDTYRNVIGEVDKMVSGTAIYEGANGISGQVKMVSNYRHYPQPGMHGVYGEGRLRQQEAYTGMKIEYDYNGGSMQVKWQGPATTVAWWASEQYTLPESWSPYAQFDVYLLFKRQMVTTPMTLRIGHRVVGQIDPSMAAHPDQHPEAVLVVDHTPPSQAELDSIAAKSAEATAKTPDKTVSPEEMDKLVKEAHQKQADANAERKKTDPGALDYLDALARARAMGQGVVAENNMKQIGQGILMYAQTNDGLLPPDLDHVRTVLGNINDLLVNLRTQSNPGFVYVKPADKLDQVANPSGTPILYELKDGKLDLTGSVMYLDGHIEAPK